MTVLASLRVLRRSRAPAWRGRNVAFSLIPVAAVSALFAGPTFAQVAYPQPDTRNPVGDWVVECYGADGSACQLYQRVLMNQNTQTALVATFAYGTDQSLRLQFAVPLGIDLTKQPRIQVGADYVTSAPVTRCTLQGCLIEGSVTGRFLDELLMANAATVSVQRVGAEMFNIPLSLTGFGEALDRIRPPEAAPLPDQDASAPETPAEPVDGEENAEAPAEADEGSVRIVAPLPEAPPSNLAPVTGTPE